MSGWEMNYKIIGGIGAAVDVCVCVCVVRK